ncbi:MAG: thiamine pyrophosphate-binding protein [Bacteroidia bacterium]
MTSGGRWIARILKQYEVTHLFTLSGGHIMELYEGCMDEDIRVIDFRHEQGAAFAAEAAGRLSGTVGVVAATAGPGVMNTVTAVANAWRSQSPMLLIGGQAPLGLFGKGALQEMNHIAVLASITKGAYQVKSVSQLPQVLHEAIQQARSGVMGPVYVEVPLDIMFDMGEVEVGMRASWYTPEMPADLPEKILSYLERAEKPVLLLGSQILFSPHVKSLPRIASALKVPIYVNGMARGSLPPRHEYLFWHSRKAALAQADLVILAGVPLDFRLNYGESLSENAHLIRLDRDPLELNRNRIPAVGAVCDPLEPLHRVVQRYVGTAPTEWLKFLRAQEEKKQKALESEAANSSQPVNPVRMCREVEKLLTEKSIIVGDGGDIVGVAAYVLRPGGVGQWLDAGPLGTLGAGAPYAIAAKLLRPQADVWVIFGDGAFGLNGMEYDTAVRFEVPFVGVVGNDAAWTQIKRAQLPMYGRAIATELLPTRYDEMVRALGGFGAWVEKTEDLAGALQAAQESQKPALVNVFIGETELRKGSISM